MILTILLFTAIILILVLSHEFGHFYAARKSGMRVDEFGFGFPPRLIKYKRGDTTYSFNLFPIGGFVKILGEDGSERDNQQSFANKPISRRVIVITAGVALNFVLAYLLFSVGHMLGTPTAVDDEQVPTYVQDIRVQILGVLEGSPAQEAGLQIGDIIISLRTAGEFQGVELSRDVQDFINRHRGKNILISVQRGDQELELNVLARQDPPEGEGAMGIIFDRVGVAKYPIHLAPIEGAKTFWTVTTGTLAAFGNMIKNIVSDGEIPDDITGPVGIFKLTDIVRNLGLVHVIQFTALISLSLGILNLAPFPALDGGRLLFLGIERLKGSPVSKKIEGMAHAIGFTLLILLIIAITFRDIERFF
jgi:regulator of sigma E protease